MLIVVTAAGATWFFVGGLGSSRADLITHRVSLGTLQMTVVERGALESARNEDVHCRVKTGIQGSSGLPQIKTVISDGTHVKKGDLLMEIEDSRFKDQLATQEIAVFKAESEWKQSEEAYKIQESQNDSDYKRDALAVELAKIELEKYLDGEYPQSLLDIKGRTRILESNLEMAMDRSFWAERMVMKQYYTRTQARAEQAKVQSAAVDLDKVQEELRVLENYTKVYRMKELRNKVEEAERTLKRGKFQADAKLIQFHTDRQTKERVHQQEQKRQREIEQEIEKCKIFAPQDGLVIYHVPESSSRSGGGGPRSTIAQGESVWEGQKLMRIPDLKHMVVVTRVHEALIARVKVGQVAEVRVDAFPDRKLKGRVKTVGNVAAKQDWSSSSDVKVYPCTIDIEEELEGLRPDMNAEVTIFTDLPLNRVLTVPVQAIVGSVALGKTRKCYVVTANGVEEREVLIGMSNDTHVHVKEGLKEGDEVVVNPRVLTGDKEKTRNGNGNGNGEARQSNGDDRPSPEARPSPNGPAKDEPEPKTGPVEKGTGRPKGQGKKGPPMGEPPGN